MRTSHAGATPIAEVAAPHQRYYRPELDILRFAAFFLVFVSHALSVDARSSPFALAFRTTGALGVPIFFMLSAFLITELLLREKAASGTISVAGFYIRRVLRIWPLYFLALFACYAVSLLPHFRPMPVSAIASYLLFVGNWCAIAGTKLPESFAHLWSISVEEQFYLVWPAFLLLANTKTVAKVVVVVAWALSQVVVMLLCSQHLTIWPQIAADSFTQLQYFAIGALISLVLRGSLPKLSASLRVTMAIGGLATLFIAGFLLDADAPRGFSTISRTFPAYLITGLGAASIFLSLLGVRVKPKFDRFVWLGKVSYGLYIYHLPCLVLVSALAAKVFLRTHRQFSPLTSDVIAFAVGLPLTIAVAGLSYKYFESAFLRLKDRFEPYIPVTNVEPVSVEVVGVTSAAN